MNGWRDEWAVDCSTCGSERGAPCVTPREHRRDESHHARFLNYLSLVAREDGDLVTSDRLTDALRRLILKELRTE